MTARLPDSNALGSRPVGQPRRGYGGGGSLGPVPDYRIPAPRGSYALDAATTDLGNTLVNAGAGLADKEKRDQDEQERLNVAKAKSSFLRAKVTADNAFDEDPDYTTYDKRYQEMLKPASEAALSAVTDPKRRALLQEELSLEETRGLERIKDKARARYKDTERGSLIETIDSNRDAALRGDPGSQMGLLNSTSGAIDAAQKRGHLSAEEAAKLRRSVTESFAERSIDAMSNVDEKLRLLAPKRPTAQAVNPSGDIYAEAADRHGVSVDYLARTAQVESGGNPNAANPSGASGLFQFMPRTAQQYGLTNPKDPAASVDAAARLGRDNSDQLAKSLGRTPNDSELYLSHQQGAGGAAALLKGGDKLAVDVLLPFYGTKAKAAQRITQNGGTVDMTAAEFAEMQQAKFDGAKPAEIQVADASGGFGFAKTGTLVDFIPPDKRVKMMNEAVRASAVLEERDQRRAALALREAGDNAEKELDAMALDGSLSRDAIERRRPVLSPTAYKSALKALDPKQADVKDNRDSVLRIEPILDSSEAPTLIDQAYQAGELSTPTYRSMREKVRTLQKDDQPDSPYRSGRKFLATALDPGQISPEPTIRQPLAIAQARALAEFDTWAESKPKMSRTEAMTQADALLQSWQTVGFGEMRLSLPRPRGFVGSKGDVQSADVEKARVKLLELLDANQITREQATQELFALEIWEQVLIKGAKK